MIEVAQWKNDSFFPPLCGDGFHRTRKPLYNNMGCRLCVGVQKLGIKTFNICGKVVEFPEKFAISIPMPRIIPLGWNTFKEAKGENEYFQVTWWGPLPDYKWMSAPDCHPHGSYTIGPPDHVSPPMFLPGAPTVIDNYKFFSYQVFELDSEGKIDKVLTSTPKTANLGGICGTGPTYNFTLTQAYSILGGLTCNPTTSEVRLVLKLSGSSNCLGPIECYNQRAAAETFEINTRTPSLERVFDIPESLFFEPASNTNLPVNYEARDSVSNDGGLKPFPCLVVCNHQELQNRLKFLAPVFFTSGGHCNHLDDITRTTVSYIPLEA